MLNFAIKAITNSIDKIQAHIMHNRFGTKELVKYKIKEIIGKGSFGVVSRIECNNQIKSLKVVYHKHIFYNREIDILLETTHKNIIKLESYFYSMRTNKGKFANIIMEYMPMSLEDILKNKTIEIDKIILLYKQSLEGLEYLHSLNICHRDIKPSNILINEKWELKICDLGSAKYMESNCFNTTYICSRYYRAPELLVDYKEYDKKIDIWSIGLVFAEFRTPGPIFKANTAKDVLNKIFNSIKIEEKTKEFYNINNNIELKEDFIEEKLADYFNNNEDLLDIFRKSLVFDHRDRFSAKQLLNCKIFNDDII